MSPDEERSLPRLANIVISITVVDIILLVSNFLVYWMGTYGMLAIAIMAFATCYGGWLMYIIFKFANHTLQSRLIINTVLNIIGIIVYIIIISANDVWTYLGICTVIGTIIILALNGYTYYYMKRLSKMPAQPRRQATTNPPATYAPGGPNADAENPVIRGNEFANYAPQFYQNPGTSQTPYSNQYHAAPPVYAPQTPYDAYLGDLSARGGYPEPAIGKYKEKLEESLSSSSSDSQPPYVPPPPDKDSSNHPYNPYINNDFH